MAVGGTDEDGPAYRRPLPPDDRVWRHPSEVALDARHHRRRRRQRTIVVGTAGAAAVALLWLINEPGAELRIEADLTALTDTTEHEDDSPETTVLAAVSWADEVTAGAQNDTVTVRTDRGTETIARALVLDDRGHLITSGQALSGADVVLITFADETWPATVVGYDAITDVSVLRVEGHLPGPKTPLAVSVETGDPIALVNPAGPADARTVAEPVTSVTSRDGNQLMGIVALDADLGSNPPGTPAVDGSGAVVGISAATAAGAPAAVVPIGVAVVVAEEIIETGHAVHARLGLTARDIGEDDPAGAPLGSYVIEVVADGPAEAGGVLRGDVVVAIDDVAVRSTAEMVATLRSHEPGDTVEVRVARDGAEIGCVVELGSHL